RANEQPFRRRPDRPAPLPREEGERIVAEVRKTLEAAGFGVIVARAFPERRLCVMIDGPAGAPVTIADCERASRAAEAAIRAAGQDPGAFEIDVESPGADRPLTRDADFERFKGEQVTVTLKEPRDGRRNFTGRLMAHAAGDVTVHVLDEAEATTF